LRFVLQLAIIFFTSYSFGQGKSSGYANLDAYYANNGYSITESDQLKLSKEDPSVIQLELYGGNIYDLSTYDLNDQKLNTQIQLLDNNDVLCATGTDKIGVDLRFDFGKFTYKLIVSTTESEKDLLLVQSYVSFDNQTKDHLKNKAHNAFHTLEGVSKIETFRADMVEKIKVHLSQVMNSSGFKVSEVKVLNTEDSKNDLSYRFYRENNYQLFGMNSIGAASDFKVISIEKKRKDLFNEDDFVIEETEISRSNQGAVLLTFENKSRNFWDFVMRLNDDKKNNQFGGLNMFIIGYKSKNNTSNDPDQNRSEKAYIQP